MQIVKEKLSAALNFFKVFGMYYEPFGIPSSRCSRYYRFLRFWPIGLFYFHAVFAVILVIHSSYVMIGTIELRTSYTTAVVTIVLECSAVTIVTYTYIHRKTLDKIWTLINQIDDFMVRYIEIPMDYKAENRQHLKRPCIHFGCNLVLSIFISKFNIESANDFNKYYMGVVFFALLNHLSCNKYIYFVSILHTRQRLLAEYFHKIKNCDHKLLSLMRVYSIMWKVARKLEKCFNWPLILTATGSYSTFLLYAHVQAIDLKNNNYRIIHYICLAPLFNLTFYCYHLQKLKSMVSGHIHISAID